MAKKVIDISILEEKKTRHERHNKHIDASTGHPRTQKEIKAIRAHHEVESLRVVTEIEKKLNRNTNRLEMFLINNMVKSVVTDASTDISEEAMADIVKRFEVAEQRKAELRAEREKKREEFEAKLAERRKNFTPRVKVAKREPLMEDGKKVSRKEMIERAKARREEMKKLHLENTNKLNNNLQQLFRGRKQMPVDSSINIDSSVND